MVAGCLLPSARDAAAQGTAGCPSPGAASPGAPTASSDTGAGRPAGTAGATQVAAPDVILYASFSARALRFNSLPRARVRFCWGDRGDSLRVIERRNLPSPVATGVTYRDVYVAVELRGHLNPECLLGARSASDTAGATISPSLLSMCAATSLRPAVQRDSQPRAPPR